MSRRRRVTARPRLSEVAHVRQVVEGRRKEVLSHVGADVGVFLLARPETPTQRGQASTLVAGRVLTPDTEKPTEVRPDLARHNGPCVLDIVVSPVMR